MCEVCQIEYCDRVAGTSVIQVVVDRYNPRMFKVIMLTLVGRPPKRGGSIKVRVCDQHSDYIQDILKRRKNPMINIKTQESEASNGVDV